MSSPWTNYSSINAAGTSARKTQLWDLVSKGMESGKWGAGDYVDWADRFADDSVFSDIQTEINTYLSLYQLQLVNITGNQYQIQSL